MESFGAHVKLVYAAAPVKTGQACPNIVHRSGAGVGRRSRAERASQNSSASFIICPDPTFFLVTMAKPESAPDPALIEDLVLANRILANEGVLDGYGHVSARHDRNPQRFLISQHRTPVAVTAADIMVLDLDANAADASGGRLTLERFIHSEIYRARPDVMAVVHSHSPAVIPFGVTGVPLRPIWHVSAFLGLADIPVFEIRNVAGPATDLLIRSASLGASLAGSLGDAPVVLMRGHGSTAVGATLKQVVYRAIYTEMNARLQLQSMQLGEVNFLTPEESATAAPFIEGDYSLSKPWEFWLKRMRSTDRNV